jgi:hypothetical protein
MTEEVVQTSNVTSNVTTSGSQSAVGAERKDASSTSSAMASQAIANKKVPLPCEYYKKPTVIDKDISTYHATGWLFGVPICSSTTLDFPTIDRINIVCFELHLMCGLGLPLSKFLVFVLNYIGCELVHLDLNANSTLICFSIVCECWLHIPPDTSLFWYFYSPAHYKRNVFSGIGLMLHRNHREEYLNVTFRGCWKGTSERWFHVNLGNTP